MTRTTRRTMALAAAVLAAASTMAATEAPPSTEVTGAVGETVDADAAFGQFYLRHVGDPAPEGHSHDYQWGTPAVLTASPEDGAVTLSGTLDLSGRVPGTVAGLGLLDPDGLAAGSNGFFSGAHVYLFTRSDGSVNIGVADGNAGGEIVQRFHRIAAADVPDTLDVTLTVDGTLDPATCANDSDDVATADGCVTLEIAGFAPITDSYGSLGMDGGNDTEFLNGGVFGWEAFEDGSGLEFTGIGYDLTVAPVQVLEPTEKDDCKDGGWEQYGFENQGRCVSSVASNSDA